MKKAYLVEILVVDYENVKLEGIKYHLEHARHLTTVFLSAKETDLGDDEVYHPLELRYPPLPVEEIKSYFDTV